MGCKCSEDGYIHLCATSRGDVDLNLRDKQIEIDDAFLRETKVLLKVNYCPICGESLFDESPKWVKSTKAFDTKYFNVGEAYKVENIATDTKCNAILKECSEESLTFFTVSKGGNGFVSSCNLTISTKDIGVTRIKKLIVGDEE